MTTPEPAAAAGDAYALDRRGIRRSFDRASATYDAAAVLQAGVREELLQRLDLVRLQPAAILDLGAGTGHATRGLRDRYRRAQVVALDVAPGMLRVAAERQSWWRRFDRVCGDAGQLPFATASFDLVYSSAMLQWCPDTDAVFAEIRRVLRPGGLLTFSTFGPDTLRELRSAWSTVDGYTHVSRFLDMHDLGEALIRNGLADPVLDVDRTVVTYGAVLGLMQDLKAIGAHNQTAGRAAGLTGRGRLKQLAAAYEPFRRDGQLPATYEIVYGQAWRPAVERHERDPGETRIPVQSIGRRSPP